MEENRITGKLAEYAVSDHWDGLSGRDIGMTKLAFLDWLAAAETGVTEDCVKKLSELSKESGEAGSCAVIGQGRRTSALAAALLNGTESHAIDFDDIHDFLSLHLCSPVLPAALAAAEYGKKGGRTLIGGSITGIQVMTALSAAMMPEHYNLGRWHATGTIGIFGAAAASGAILGLSREEMENCFGICAGLLCGIQLNFGTMSKPMAAGMAAKNGLMAALLAKKGFTGRSNIFDTDFLDNISEKKAEKEKILERLYGPLGIHELRFKRYPCGAPTHSGIINCRKILAGHPAKPEQIEKIVFEPYPRAIRLAGITHPKTGLEGKFSIPFAAAAQIVFGQVTIETFTDEKVGDPRVRYLLDRMEMAPNEEFTPSRGGRATIYFKDGSKGTSATYLLGHELDFTEAERETEEKYREIMEPRVGGKRAEEIRLAVGMLEEMETIEKFTGLL